MSVDIKQIKNTIQGIEDPDTSASVLDMVSHLTFKEGTVRFALDAIPGSDWADEVALNLTNALSQLDGVSDIQITQVPTQIQSTQPLPDGLADVGAIIAVSSCKGGVGKSSVAVNTAFALAEAGASVGIFDADIYGPSLPTMVRIDPLNLDVEDDQIVPLEYNGVKLMSFGYVNPPEAENQASILRGPMVTQIVRQLLFNTKWGRCDYLIIDFPPGTGDIQITLTQALPITGALIVSTPQQISYIDVDKGVEMFDKMNVPTLGIVENMSYFTCNECETPHHLFGQGGLQKFARQQGIEHTYQLPIDKELSKYCDRGTPYIVAEPNTDLAKQFKTIASNTVRELRAQLYSAHTQPEITYTEEALSITIYGSTYDVPLKTLREQCQCAHCHDEFTGESKISSIPEPLSIIHVFIVGNYAINIEWHDKHNSLFQYNLLCKLGKKVVKTT